MSAYQDRASILAEARSWIGTPFRRQQHKKGQGCDCVSFVVEVLRATGFPPALDFQYPIGYSPIAIDDTIKNYCEAHLRRLDDPSSAQPADIALVTWGKLYPTHVGFLGNYAHPQLTPPLSIIHAMLDVRRVAEHIYSGTKWVQDTVGLYRIPGIG